MEEVDAKIPCYEIITTEAKLDSEKSTSWVIYVSPSLNGKKVFVIRTEKWH